MTRKELEISPRVAAKILGCHRRTVYRWCERAVAGESARIQRVRQDVTGHYWIVEAEIRALKARFDRA